MNDGAIDYERLLNRAPVAFDENVVADRFSGSSVLVTGAGGSIGTELVELLAANGAKTIVCVESHEPSLFRLGLRMREQFPAIAIRLALVDARQTDRVGRLLRDHSVDAIFHLAAYKHVPLAEENCDQVVSINVLATLGLIDIAEQNGVQAMVYPSTDKAVRPPSIYGATKRITELELSRRAATGGSVILGVARLVNVFGTAGNVVEIFASRIQRGLPLGVTDKRMTRYWMTRREAAMLLASTACLPQIVGTYLLELGAAIPILDIAERLGIQLTGQMPEVAIIGLRPGERLVEELTYPFERLESTALPGIQKTVADQKLPDLRGIIEALGRAVSEGDIAAVRRLLAQPWEGATAA